MEDKEEQTARIGSCHIAARSLLNRANVKTFPVSIKILSTIIIVDYPKLRFHNTDKLPKKIYALTYRDGDDIDIAFNNTVAPNRQKFSVAHELGHLYMGHVHGGGAIDFENANQLEQEANEFAAELIMPSKLLRVYIVGRNRSIKEVADAFKVSEEALWWRLLSTGLWKYLRT